MYIMHVTAVEGLIGTHLTMSLSDVDDLSEVTQLASWRTFCQPLPAGHNLGQLEEFLDTVVSELVKGLSSLQDGSGVNS